MKERSYLSRTGPEGETLFPVDGLIFIGSRDCEVVVKDAAPRHCQIARTSEGFVALDLTGQKLIKVNGTRTERHLLREGEVLAVGSAEFRWTVVLEAEEEAPAEPAKRPTRRREKTPAPMPMPVPKSKSRVLVIGGVAAAAAVVLIAVLIFALTSSKPSNMDRVARREIRPVPESKTPSPGAVPVVVAQPTAAATEPRRDPGGVPAPAPVTLPEPVRTFEPAPFVVAGADRPPVTPAVPVARPKSTSAFSARYAALIKNLEETLARGHGLEAAHRELLEASGSAPRGAAEQLRALAASLKAAVTCGDCAGGRVTCDKCDGKGRVDLNCVVCDGKGRVRASGAVGDAQVSVKCRNCEGKRVFRGVTCPSCARSGKIVCTSCKGSVWPSDRCARVDCKSGRIACPQCTGRGFELVQCPGLCVRGRQRAPGAVEGADVTMKCRECEVNGQQGNGTIKADCKVCNRSGKLTCDTCGGAFAKKTDAQRASIPTSKVYSSERCADCAGGGCDECFGLGSRIRPLTN